MKKLIATAVVAAAAYGAFAIETGVWFEDLELGAAKVDALNTATGNYWSEPEDAGNAYNIVASEELKGLSVPRHDYFVTNDTPANALSVKTTFGKPLSFAVNAGATPQPIGDGIYFDSLIKFTVCEEAPEANLYGDAKIAIWLQEQYDEEDNIECTNLVVRAGNLSYSEALQVTQTDYVCDQVEGDFADAWHRVTIKTIADITDGDGVPGFAIYIDGEPKSTLTAKWDESFKATYTLSEIGKNLAKDHLVFPSLKQSGDEKSTVACAQFDGTGSVNELIFTATAPSFASNEEYLDDKFSLQIGGNDAVPYKTFADAVAAINDLSGVDEGPAPAVTLSLVRGISFEGPVTFNTTYNGDITLDLNGYAITNTAASGYAIIIETGTYMTITDRSAAKTGAIVSDLKGENNGAISLADESSLTLTGGKIDGGITVGTDAECRLMGGTIKQDDIDPVEGFKLEQNGDFYDVVEVITYTITVAAGENVTVAVVTNGVAAGAAGTYVVNAGDSATVTYTANAGYEFADEATFTFENIAENKEVTAPTATAISYSISYELVDESEAGDEPDTGSYTVESGTVTLTQPAAVTGYTFSGWYAAQDLNGDEVTQFTVDTVNPANKTFYGKFTATPYTITYVLNGGDALTGDYATSYTIKDKSITLPDTATRTGYMFAGWTNAVGAVVTTFTVDEKNLGDVTFYASWTADTPAEPETPVIPEGDTSVEVEVDISDNATPEEIDQILSEVVNSVKVAEPSVLETADQKAEYQNLFTKKAKIVDGKVVVTAEIKETVKEDVAESAVKEVLESAADEPEMYVPRGLYYKITTMEDLDGTNSKSEKGVSSGAVKVDKPGKGKGKGFIKIQIGTQEYK